MKKQNTIGERIKATREARSMTASDLARLANVSPTAVWNWENSGTQPQAKALHSLSQVLGVSKRWLLTGEDDPQRAGDIPPHVDSDGSVDLSIYPLEELLKAIDRKGFAVTVTPRPA